MKKVQNIYDNDKFFNDYKAMRDAKRNALEIEKNRGLTSIF